MPLSAEMQIILWISADIVDVNKFTTTQSLLLALPDEIRPGVDLRRREASNDCIVTRRPGERDLPAMHTTRCGNTKTGSAHSLDCLAAEDFEHCCLLLVG